MKKFILPAVLTSIELGIVLSACLVGIYLWNIYDAYCHIPGGPAS